MERKIFILLLISLTIYVKGQSDGTHLNINKDSLAFELSQLYGADQSLRNIEDYQRSTVSIKLDSVNFLKLIAFIRKYGFPCGELLGEKNMKYECVEAAAAAILLHSPDKVVNPEVYKLLKHEVSVGHLKPLTLSYFLDKYYVYHERYSLYGSPFKDMTPCKGVRFKDKEVVNKARVDIGLGVLPDSAFVDCIK